MITRYVAIAALFLSGCAKADTTPARFAHLHPWGQNDGTYDRVVAEANRPPTPIERWLASPEANDPTVTPPPPKAAPAAPVNDDQAKVARIIAAALQSLAAAFNESARPTNVEYRP